MPMQWNEQADAKLFAHVLKIHVVKLDYQALAKAMGDTVTPKAISHRISKIKEKAQLRRFDWESYSNPPTSCTPRKRGPKQKSTDDDEVLKKRVKAEKTVIKVEENGPTAAPWNIGEYCWSKEWPPTAITREQLQQQAYPLYDSGETNTNKVTDGGYGDDGSCDDAHGNFAVNVAGCNNVGVHLDRGSAGIKATREVGAHLDRTNAHIEAAHEAVSTAYG